jgi:uncharacterized coiled-coil protein SlyX
MGIEYSKNTQYSVLETEIERKEEIIDSYKTMITEQNKIIDQLREEVIILKEKINKVTILVDSIRNERKMKTKNGSGLIDKKKQNKISHGDKKNDDSDISCGFLGYVDEKKNIEHTEGIENEIFLSEYPSEEEDKPLDF